MEQKKILVVEDDSFVLDIYHTKLVQEGFDVETACNGLEAITKLEKMTKLPDLVLLDIVMPYMDGLEFLKKMKQQNKLEGVPVVLLTNLSQKEDIEEGLKLGASDYLIKSHFTPSEVLTKINQYLNG